jgi:tRNA uridine 5-carbamoylmethylation protein Kti12
MINLSQTLQQFANELVQELKQNAPKNTGALSNSIKTIVTDDSLTIEMAGYADFVNKGINGKENNRGSIYSFRNKKPPISSISSYAKSIGANPYALQKSIYKNGIKPSLFIDNTITDKKIDELADKLINNIIQNI